MNDGALDKHQLAGLDQRERGFSRPVEFEWAGEGYRAVLRYESDRIVTEPQPTQDASLQLLIAILQEQGYRQLKTQRNFRKGIYLGSQELWVEYADPSPSESRRTRLLGRIAGWFRRLPLHDIGS